MGKSVMPKYRLEHYTRHGWIIFSAWNVKSYGNPSMLNLGKFRAKYHESLKKGGCNEHLGESARIGSLRIIEQKNLNIAAVYKAPAFEVID